MPPAELVQELESDPAKRKAAASELLADVNLTARLVHKHESALAEDDRCMSIKFMRNS